MAIRTNLKLGAFSSIAGTALLLAGCGGGSGGGGGSDEAFIEDICAAGVEFFSALEGIDTQEADPAKALEAFAGPFEDFANAVEDADPPSDLEEWHTQAVASLNDIVAKLKDGDIDALSNLGDSPFPEAPADAQERLDKIAADNEDCQEADLGFGTS